MSCCFAPQKEKYEFGGDQPQSKDRKNKKNKQKKKAARNGTAKVENGETKDVIADSENKTEDIVVNTHTDFANGELSKTASDTVHQGNNVDEKGETIGGERELQAEENETHKQNGEDIVLTKDTEQQKESEQEKRISQVSNECEDQTKTEDSPPASEDKTNNNEPKKEVFVISTDKRNSFYGAALRRKEEEKQKEEEKKRKEEERKAREEERKKKLLALKAANAPKIEVEDVSEKMDENRLQEEPPPDYSDDEADNGKEEDYVELRKTVKNRISAMLTREEWDQILDRTGLDEVLAKEVEIPEPDYDGAPQTRPLGRSHTFNVGGLNPDGTKNKSPESKARQDLHREMMMNKKFGIDVLHRKSELQKEFSKRKEKEKQRDKEPPRRNSLEIKLQEMANKMQKKEESAADTKEEVADEESQPEFLKVYSKMYKSKSTS